VLLRRSWVFCWRRLLFDVGCFETKWGHCFEGVDYFDGGGRVCFVSIVIIVFSQMNFLIHAIFLHVIFRNTCVVRIRALSFMVGGFCFSHFVEE
jgi:hypothetical protein